MNKRVYPLKSIKKLALLAHLCCVSALTMAESSPFFIGVKGGYQWAQDDSFSHTTPKAPLFGVFGGWHFLPTWRWDIGYQFHNELKADATSVDVNTWLIESALRYDWHLQDPLSLYGRLGAAYWNIKKNQRSVPQQEAKGVSPLGEVGVSYEFTPNMQLSVGYQYINKIGRSNTGHYDSHAALVSLSYAFGASDHTPLIAPLSHSIPPAPSTKKQSAIKSYQPQTQRFVSKTAHGLFGFDSIEPSTEFLVQLSQIASILNTYPQARAIIVGYTDTSGSTAYNQTLAERRAKAVANKLMELQVSPTQLQWRGAGESQSVATTSTITDQAQNRRVEVTIPSFEFKE